MTLDMPDTAPFDRQHRQNMLSGYSVKPLRKGCPYPRASCLMALGGTMDTHVRYAALRVAGFRQEGKRHGVMEQGELKVRSLTEV
jgi:hypothetical protein